MYPSSWAQDVLRCTLCESLAIYVNCEICQLHLCKICEGKHILDKSKKHRLVPFEKRGTTPICQKHSSKFSKKYDTIFSVRDHLGPNCTFKGLETKEILQKDLEELENVIYPRYQKIASNITVQKDDLKKNSHILTTTINKHGDDIHREIDTMIEKLKSDLDDINSKNIKLLNKQECEITCIISEIKQIIANLKKIMKSDDGSLVSAYKSTNAELREMSPKPTVFLPSFTPKKINKEQIHQQFGSLSGVEKPDPNSLKKIVESFNELHNYQWTDALYELINKFKISEEDAIQTLLEVTEDSYKYCKNISSKRYTNILAELTLWKLAVPNETSSLNRGKCTPRKILIESEKSAITFEEIETLHTLVNFPSSTVNWNEIDATLAKIGLNATNLSNIKDMLESSNEGTGALVSESFYRKLGLDRKWKKDVLESVDPFIKECVRICWLMVNMDPPIYLKPSEKRGSKFNKDFYKAYTRDGEKVDFFVWPALFLQENGLLLCKGFVQPKVFKKKEGLQIFQ